MFVQPTSWRGYLGLHISLGLVLLCGCPAKQANRPADSTSTGAAADAGAGPMRVLVWDDAPLAAVMQREWHARSDSQCAFINASSSAWLAQDDQRLEADVIIFPPNLLGQLAERRLLRALPSELIDAPGYEKANIFDLIRRREMQWDGKPYAVPFGSAPFMLFSRTDLVPESATPTTWDELQRTVDDLASAEPSIVPLLQPLADGWASKLLLARAAPYFHDRASVSTVFDFRSLKPRIASPPFVRALRQLVADQRGALRQLTPREVLDEFLAGKAAMAITWPSATGDAGDAGNAGNAGRQEMSRVEFPVAISLLPGSHDRYDYGDEGWTSRDRVSHVTLLSATGRMGAMSRTGRHVELATRFLGWATGPEFSGIVSPRSDHTAPFRTTHHVAPGNWLDARLDQDAAAQYATAVTQAMNRPEAILCVRIPAQHRYMAILDLEVTRAAQHASTPEAALIEAARAWESISDDEGLPGQLKAYQRSLGIAN